MNKVINVEKITMISLGWGVQSWTLASMSALGELPRVDYAVHADTHHERQGTYEHAAKWTPWLADHGIEVVTVSSSRTDVVREDWSSAVLIPAFTLSNDGSKGMVKRMCTQDWKIKPIRRFLRSKLKKLPPGAVDSWHGISLDEFQRMRTSDVAYINNVYPLVERRITRQDCIDWLTAKGLDVPPKSACTFCPYHTLGEWGRMKREGGPDWQEAQGVDRAIRRKRQLDRGKPGYEVRKGIDLFVHPSRKPLQEATAVENDQLALDLEIPCDGGVCFV